MVFTWFDPSGPMWSRAEVGKALLDVVAEVDMPDPKGAFIIGAMCMFQEAGTQYQGARRVWIPGNNNDPAFRANPGGFRHDSMGNDGASVGPVQQQAGDNWGWGGNLGDPEGTRRRMDLRESLRLFYGHPSSGLKKKGYNASNARAAGDSIQRVQGSSFPRAYDQWWNEAHALYEQVTGDGTPPPIVQPSPAIPQNPGAGWRGDPTWLPAILKAEGLDVQVLDVAMIDGHGDFGDVWGVMWHHTGGWGDTPRSLSNGSPNLSGPVCNLFITPEGVVWVIAIGVAYHAGYGIYPGLPENGANQHTIGIECLHDGRAAWPAAQREAMVKTGAAITRFLKYGKDRNIAHKEWAGADNPLGINKQGKPDPGNFDMRLFRDDIERRIHDFTPTTGTIEDEIGALLDMATTEEKDLLVQAAKKILGIWSPAQIADESKRGYASRSIYRDPEAPERTVDDPIGFILYGDASGHEERVEHYALLGHPYYAAIVRSVALGHGAVNTTDAKSRAGAVLRRVNQLFPDLFPDDNEA